MRVKVTAEPPRALDVTREAHGYPEFWTPKYRPWFGQPLVVTLDGVPVDRVVAYDVDAGFVRRWRDDLRRIVCRCSRAHWDEAFADCDCLTETRHGVVTVTIKEAP